MPTRFPVPTIPMEGRSNGSSAGGSKRKSAPTYGRPRQGAACQPKPLGRPEHRLVREVDDDLRLVLECVAERVDERDAVVLAAAELLRPADQVGRHELVRELLERVANGRDVVLAVDDGQRPLQLRLVTSPSIRAVYFSKARVSVENWMIRSCPWNGYFRHTSMCGPDTSIRL